MRTIRPRWLLTAVFLGALADAAGAAVNCGAGSNTVLDAVSIGPRHHPIGRPLPQRDDFNQPSACDDGGWFFDLNHNGQPDPGEPRLFGPQRVTACMSCHADSPDPKTEAAASVFLRQDAQVLCLICHKL